LSGRYEKQWVEKKLVLSHFKRHERRKANGEKCFGLSGLTSHSPSETLQDPYPRKSINLLGSFEYSPEDRGSKVGATWVAKYTESGEKLGKVNYEKVALMKEFSVRLA
jgi:hypothetical protein